MTLQVKIQNQIFLLNTKIFEKHKKARKEHPPYYSSGFQDLGNQNRKESKHKIFEEISLKDSNKNSAANYKERASQKSIEERGSDYSYALNNFVNENPKNLVNDLPGKNKLILSFIYFFEHS